MSTVIIGGGGDARHAIQQLEHASLTMTTIERANAEKLLTDFVKDVNDFCKDCAE